MNSAKKEHRGEQQISDNDRLRIKLFTMPAEAIAESLASKEISPQGPASGLRLLTFYINYSGRGLSPSRRKNLEKARKLLAERVVRELAEREHDQKMLIV